LKVAVWFRRGRRVIVAPRFCHLNGRQGTTLPLIPLSEFPKPAQIAFERLRYNVLAALHASVTEARQSERIPFSGKDGVQNPQTTYTSNVVQNAMNLQIHLIERLLHMQDVLCCHLDQAAAMSPK
jgi:hypothetical protein